MTSRQASTPGPTTENIRDRAKGASKTAIGAWLAEPYPNKADDRAATEVESALRTLLLDLQREIAGLKDWDDMIAKTDVLALIAGLLEAGQ